MYTFLYFPLCNNLLLFSGGALTEADGTSFFNALYFTWYGIIHTTQRAIKKDPEECIECGVCEPECPAGAIKHSSEPKIND
ncbi:MAG: 4Fe-4S dicluster domain-containing protein [Candidatus Hodgkinia cicadicola]